MNKTKLIPPFVMLAATSLVAVVTYLRDYPFNAWLILVFGVMVLFLFLGEALRQIIDFFALKNEKERLAMEAEAEREREEAERLAREASGMEDGNEVSDLPPI